MTSSNIRCNRCHVFNYYSCKYQNYCPEVIEMIFVHDRVFLQSLLHNFDLLHETVKKQRIFNFHDALCFAGLIERRKKHYLICLILNNAIKKC